MAPKLVTGGPGGGAGGPPGKPLDEPLAKLQALCAAVAAGEGTFYPCARVLRIVEIIGGKERQYSYAAELPLAELPRAPQWLAMHAGPGLFCVQLLDEAGAQMRGSCELRIVADERARVSPAVAAAPGATVVAPAGPAPSSIADTIALTNAIVNVAKAINPPAAAAAPAGPAFNPVDIFKAGLDLAGKAHELGGKKGKKAKGVLAFLEALDEHAESILPIVNAGFEGALQLGEKGLKAINKIAEERKEQRAHEEKMAAAAAAQQAMSSPTPAASPTTSEGAQPPLAEETPKEEFQQVETPPATDSTTEEPAEVLE